MGVKLFTGFAGAREAKFTVGQSHRGPRTGSL